MVSSGAASHLLATDTLSSPVLHRLLRDETASISSLRTASPTRQYSDRRALNSTVIVTKNEGLKSGLTGDGLAATRGSERLLPKRPFMLRNLLYRHLRQTWRIKVASISQRTL